MAKFVGYIIAFLGLVAIALSYEPIKKTANLAIPAQITPLYLMIGGLVLVVIGILFIRTRGGSRKQKNAEVPIYHGKDIVGFRRLGKQ